MKQFLFPSLIALCSLASSTISHAQEFNSPVDYMDAISNSQQEMNKTYLTYMSAAAHSGRAKKIENMRQKTIESILNCKFKVNDLPYYKSDNSLRKSSIDYIDMCYKVFNDDYAHIVNMEEIAEQSFDEMEAYLLLQEKTAEKLNEAYENMDKAARDFAAKYNIKFIDTKSELGDKMEKASDVMHYHNKVYLLFFKCNWQDGQLVQALEKKNLNNIEQSRNALLNYANEGLAILDTLQPFDGDHTFENSCKTALKMYADMAKNELPKLSDFFLKQENFEKIKKAFELKADDNHTKQDIDAYNEAVNEMNAAAKLFNTANEKCNNSRNQVIQNWNSAEKTFYDAHMPFYG